MTPTAIDRASVGAVHRIYPISGSAVSITALATPTWAVSTTFISLNDQPVACDGVCVGGIVFAAVAICIGTLLSLGFTCKRNRGRWFRNYSHRHTNSSAVATSVTSVNTGRSQTSGSYELPVIAPRTKDTPLLSCNITHNLSFVNATPDNQTSIVTFTNTSFESVSTLVTSLNSISTGELFIPLAPIISTVPLPPVDGYDHLPQYNPTPFTYENYTGLQPWRALDDVAEGGNETDSLNSNMEPIGSLGLILE